MRPHDAYRRTGTGTRPGAALDGHRRLDHRAGSRVHRVDQRAVEADARRDVRPRVRAHRLARHEAGAARVPSAWIARALPDSADRGARRGAAHRLPRWRDRLVRPHRGVLPAAGSADHVAPGVARDLAPRTTAARTAAVPPLAARVARERVQHAHDARPVKAIRVTAHGPPEVLRL